MLILSAATAHAAPLDAESRRCQDCHSTQGFWLRDAVTGEETSLTVDTPTYLRSSHGELACLACHDRGYDRMPHDGPRSLPRFLCVDCHKLDVELEPLQLPLRRQELLRSAHSERPEHSLDCHDCHDPHVFRPIRELPDVAERISASNAICLRCHGPERPHTRFAELEDATRTHGLFPNPRAHFRKVKCVACHTLATSRTKHEVLPQERSVRDCAEACHTGGAPVLRPLYADAALSDRDPLREYVYVIGATRTPRLDRLSQIGFAALMACILAHTVLRAIHAVRGTKRRSRGED